LKHQLMGASLPKISYFATVKQYPPTEVESAKTYLIYHTQQNLEG
jgi:hypothetical protein